MPRFPRSLALSHSAAVKSARPLRTLLGCLTGLVSTAVILQAAPPQLKTQGHLVVVKSTGTPVRLTGVNIPSLEWGNGEHLKVSDAHGGSVTVATGTWKANIIRLPVKASRWAAGGTYLTTIDDVIARASAANCYVILDLHEYQKPTPACATFWTQAANRYKNNPAVLFGLLNEPHGTTWEVWRNGDGTNPGMQDLVDTVRATGATNVLVAGGLDYAYNISGVLQGYALTDTASGNGIIYDSHLYPWKNYWQSTVGTVAQQYPVILGEIGHPDGTTFIGLTFEGPTTWVPKAMDWVDTHDLHWTGWAMHPAADPVLITDWNYTPSTHWGVPALARLQAYRNATAERVIGGKVIGVPGTRNLPNSGVITDWKEGAVAPFAGATNFFYNAPTASDAWTGLEFATPQRVTKISFVPRLNNGALMVGGIFQGSNSANFSNATTLHTVVNTPVATAGTFTTVNVSNTGGFRYVRYLGPANSYCNIAAIKFYGYPAPAANVNLLTNPSFDASGATQTPSGWTEWKDVATSESVSGGGHSGSCYGKHSSTAASYEVSTYQTKTGLANGTYTLKAWVRSSGGQSGAQLYAKNYGGSKIATVVPTAAGWTQITLSNINVTNGTCEVGMWSRVFAAGQWMHFDDLEFYKN